MSYREPAPKPCARGKCTRMVEDGPPDGGTVGTADYCSWGCQAGEDSRVMWGIVREARARAAAARLSA